MTADPAPAGLLAQLVGWAASVSAEQIPARVLALSNSQLVSQLAAIRAGLTHPLGRRLVAAFGSPLQADPARAAAVSAALGSWLNLDDTAYAGHLGPSTVAVPLAYARGRQLDGPALLTAITVANECAARITAAATLGPLRGQSALHTHLAGTVAGRLCCEAAPVEQWSDALALAFAAPGWPNMHAFLGSDAKALHALGPVRAGLDACDAAAAGLHGPSDLLEHPDGFLARFATVPLPAELTWGLGRRWHTDTLSFKLRPGGPGIDAAVDCCLELHAELSAVGVVDGRDIARVEVTGSRYTIYAGQRAERYLDGAASPISSLLLAAPYAVATTLLTGDLTVADFDQPALADPWRWRLAERVSLIEDPAMTEALLASTAPFGEAVRHAGPAGQQWLHAFGGQELAAAAPVRPVRQDSFQNATKRTPARVRVQLADGRSFSRSRQIPLGGAGPDTRARHRDLVRAKFIGQGGSARVADGLLRLDRCSGSQVRELITRALAD